MLQHFFLNLTLFLFASDIVLTLLALFCARILRLTLPYGVEILPKHLEFPWTLYPIVATIWCVIFLIIPIYDAKKTYRAIDQLQFTVVAVAFATVLFAGVSYFFFRELSRFLFLYFFILDLAFLLGLRIILRFIIRVWRGGWPGKKMRLLIVGAGSVGQRLHELMTDYESYGVEVVGFLDDNLEKSPDILESSLYLGSLDVAANIIAQKQVDEVIFALPPHAHNRVMETVHNLENLSVNIRFVPDLFGLSFVQTPIEDFEGIPLVSLKSPAMDPFQRMIKRGFDLVVGSIALVMATPIMGIISLVIKLDSTGPVFYPSERVGQNGRIFKMYKFRSMTVDADHRREEVVTYTEDGKPIHKQPNDPRVTRFGRFIRRLSLDELPQLLNVMRGDMSLIGPRPEMPWLVEQYEPWQYKRFSVPQGMTGWWQVNGRSEKPMHFHVEEDLYYIQNYSLLLDLAILWKTIGAVVKKSGAF